MKRSKAKTIACIAAICYILYGITILIDWVIPSFRRQEYLMAFMPIVFFGGLIGLAVAHMLGNKKAAVIAAGVTVLYWVYRLTIWFCAWNIFGFLAAVSLVLLFVFALKGNDIVKKLWFAPAVFMLAYHIINIIQINEIIDFSYYFSVRLLLRVCFPLFVIIAGLILTGLWLKNGSSESEATTAAMNSQAISRTSVYSSAVSVADKLKTYKDLLDCGAITEEEFKAKKSELLK
jgi:hypothetical protein